MDYLLDLKKNKGKYTEKRIVFKKTYTDVFPTEDAEFRYDGIAMYINNRILKDFDLINPKDNDNNNRKDLDSYRCIHRIGLKHKTSKKEL